MLLHCFRMPRARPALAEEIFGDKVVYERYLLCNSKAATTSRFFSGGRPNVYPSRKQVDAAVKRHLAGPGVSAAFWARTRSKPKGGRPPILDHIAKILLVHLNKTLQHIFIREIFYLLFSVSRCLTKKMHDTYIGNADRSWQSCQ